MMTALNQITRHPHPHGNEACIRDTNINVWGLVEWKRLGRTDVEIVDSIPELTLDDLAAAWEYAAEHPGEINAFIRRNEEA